MSATLDLPENIGTDVTAIETATYLVFRATIPKPRFEPDHHLHILRFLAARMLVRLGFRPVFVRPVVRLNRHSVRVDVAAKDGGRVVAVLCEPHEHAADVMATVTALLQADVDVLIVSSRVARPEELAARLGTPPASSNIRYVTIAVAPFKDETECDTWVFAASAKVVWSSRAP